MNKINYFMPSINGQIISCEYEIKVSLYFDCFVDYNHRPRVIIPIYLVHQLPIDYQLEIQEQIDFENALKKSKMEEEDNKYFNNKLMKNKDNYNNKMDNMNEIEEDNELPSLEVIEEAHKNQIKDNENKINLNKINVINDNNVINNNNDNYVNINEIVNNDNIDDSCPPPNSLYESAPLPFQIKDDNNNDNICDSNNFENKFNNQININRISESPEDFSVLNNINSL